MESVKRTAEIARVMPEVSVVRFPIYESDPTDESVGYFQPSAAQTLIGKHNAGHIRCHASRADQ